MTGIVYASLGDIGDALVVVDATRRVYLAASRDGSYLHVVSPSQVEVVHPETGEILRRVGELACICKGGAFRGRCYRLEQAEAFEAGQADQAAAPVWMQDFDAPVGAGESVEASRG